MLRSYSTPKKAKDQCYCGKYVKDHAVLTDEFSRPVFRQLCKGEIIEVTDWEDFKHNVHQWF